MKWLALAFFVFFLAREAEAAASNLIFVTGATTEIAFDPDEIIAYKACDHGIRVVFSGPRDVLLSQGYDPELAANFVLVMQEAARVEPRASNRDSEYAANLLRVMEEAKSGP